MYTGGWNGRGYGNIWDKGCTRSAHVVSYEVHTGPVPEGLYVLHSCDNKWCINPEHLFVGTQQDNIDDMVSKGRDGFAGEKNGKAILNEEKVRQIKNLLRDSGLSCRTIGERFGVSGPAIMQIKHGRNWGHI